MKKNTPPLPIILIVRSLFLHIVVVWASSSLWYCTVSYILSLLLSLLLLFAHHENESSRTDPLPFFSILQSRFRESSKSKNTKAQWAFVFSYAHVQDFLKSLKSWTMDDKEMQLITYRYLNNVVDSYIMYNTIAI